MFRTTHVVLGLALTYGAACAGESAKGERSKATGGTAGSEAGASAGAVTAGASTGGSAGKPSAGGGGTSSGRGGAAGSGTSGSPSGGRAGTNPTGGAGVGGGQAGGPTSEGGAGGAIESYGNPLRDIVRTELSVDLGDNSAVARLTLAPSQGSGVSLEALGLDIHSVTIADVAVAFVVRDGTLEIDVPASGTDTIVQVEYRFRTYTELSGYLRDGSTFTWPYYCGNLFPCHSDPADGMTFHLDVTGEIGTLVYPAEVASDVPSYVLAWAEGDYVDLDLGITTQGTTVHAYYFYGDPNGLAHATTGTKDLREAFEWYEKHLGPYRYGSKAGSVAVRWPGNVYGGMEHHPYWHVSQSSMKDPLTHVHEAAHGWFGDGVRLRCWEDFVLSEGTASYLAAHVLEALGDTDTADQAWQTYEAVAAAPGAFDVPAWFDGCGKVDVIEDRLYSDATYARGALFYRALEQRIGASSVEAALAALYVAKAGDAAGVNDLLDAIDSVSGYDATECAEAWLKGPALPVSTACP